MHGHFVTSLPQRYAEGITLKSGKIGNLSNCHDSLQQPSTSRDRLLIEGMDIVPCLADRPILRKSLPNLQKGLNPMQSYILPIEFSPAFWTLKVETTGLIAPTAVVKARFKLHPHGIPILPCCYVTNKRSACHQIHLSAGRRYRCTPSKGCSSRG